MSTSKHQRKALMAALWKAGSAEYDRQCRPVVGGSAMMLDSFGIPCYSPAWRQGAVRAEQTIERAMAAKRAMWCERNG